MSSRSILSALPYGMSSGNSNYRAPYPTVAAGGFGLGASSTHPAISSLASYQLLQPAASAVLPYTFCSSFQRSQLRRKTKPNARSPVSPPQFDPNPFANLSQFASKVNTNSAISSIGQRVYEAAYSGSGVAMMKALAEAREYELQQAQNDKTRRDPRPVCFQKIVNFRGHEGGTPLHVASEQGNSRVVSMLLAEGVGEFVDVNAFFEKGRTALFLASLKGHADVVRALVDAALVDVNLADWDGQSPLGAACEKGFLDVVELLVQRPEILLNEGKGMGADTPFMQASVNGHARVVRLLVGLPGVDFGVTTNDGFQALHLACWNGHFQVVEILLAHVGADQLTHYSTKGTPLHLASRNGDAGIVWGLLVRDADAAAEDHSGSSSVHRACSKGRVDAARFLLMKVEGSEVGRRNDRHKTPLHLACTKRSQVESLAHFAEQEIQRVTLVRMLLIAASSIYAPHRKRRGGNVAATTGVRDGGTTLPVRGRRWVWLRSRVRTVEAT